jgi:hypothetical protein
MSYLRIAPLKSTTYSRAPSGVVRSSSGLFVAGAVAPRNDRRPSAATANRATPLSAPT